MDGLQLVNVLCKRSLHLHMASLMDLLPWKANESFDPFLHLENLGLHLLPLRPQGRSPCTCYVHSSDSPDGLHLCPCLPPPSLPPISAVCPPVPLHRPWTCSPGKVKRLQFLRQACCASEIDAPSGGCLSPTLTALPPSLPGKLHSTLKIQLWPWLLPEPSLICRVEVKCPAVGLSCHFCNGLR